MQSYNNKILGSLVHISAFSKYIIPFGNFIVPLMIWVCNKKNDFIKEHGRQSLNFQISIFLYAVILISITVAGAVAWGVSLGSLEEFYLSNDGFIISNQTEFLLSPYLLFFGVVLLLALGLFLLEILCVINATARASEGKEYQYPLCINFIKLESSSNQSKNEQF